MPRKHDFEHASPEPLRVKESVLGTIGEAAGLLVLCLLIHGLVLRFVFPGFYEPTLFEHSDFYAPSSLRYSSQNIFSMLSWGRPIGMVYLYAVGWIGTEASIWATLGMIFANMIFLAMIVRRFCGIGLSWPFVAAFSLFCYCLLSHPYFFTMAAHDALAQLSFLFLVFGFAVLLARPSPTIAGLVALFVLMVLAFSSKESFALSAFWLLACIGLVRNDRRLLGAACLSGLGVAAFLVSFVYGLHVNSSFISDSSDAANTYHQSYNPVSMASQFADYISSGTPAPVLLLLLAAYLCLMFFLAPRFRWVSAALIGAGVAAIIPNTALPHHFFPGYSWNMAYFLFAPLLLFPLVRGRVEPRLANAVGLSIAAFLVVALPYLWRPSYALNDWTMQEAAIQRNVRHTLDVLTKSASLGQDHRRVLVTGLSDMFSPFDVGEAIREWVGNSDAHFDVVSYAPKPSTAEAVHFLMPDDVRIDSYTDIWAFAADGTGREITEYDGLPNIDFLQKREIILYPDVLAALGWSHFRHHDAPPDPNQLLQCGIKLFNYHAYELAIAVLNRSIAQLPKNPYAFFYEALAYQALGRRDEALRSARQAVASDAPSPNRYFTALAESLQQ